MKDKKIKNLIIAINEFCDSGERFPVEKGGNIIWLMKSMDKILMKLTFDRDNKEFFSGCGTDYLNENIWAVRQRLIELKGYVLDLHVSHDKKGKP